VLTSSSERYQFLSCDGDHRTVELPTGMSAGLDFVIAETELAGYDLTVALPDSTVVTTLGSVQSTSKAIVVFDGADWRVLPFLS
jgi:hypothetical protein